MDQNIPFQQHDAYQSQEWEKQTTLMKGQRQNSQFQKNYPKNIFIPIIEYLADLGLQTQYQSTVGTREQFQGKNVVSLSLIYQLVSEPWFKKHVNKKLLEVNITNKILMNSKIKKKLFHLKVARILLQSKANQAKQFKKLVSRKANAIALEIVENDELFQHPSSVIYLLTLFLNILKTSVFSKIQSFKSISDSPDSQNQDTKNFQNSKQEFKNLTKNIIIAFSKIKASESTLKDLELNIRDAILERAYEIHKKFDLVEGAPTWELFLNIVVNRCIKYKIQGIKMTNSLLNQWIIEFKQSSNQLGIDEKLQKQKQDVDELPLEFKPIILVNPPGIKQQTS